MSFLFVTSSVISNPVIAGLLVNGGYVYSCINIISPKENNERKGYEIYLTRHNRING